MRALELLHELRGGQERVVVSGCVGPCDDGYRPAALMSPRAAEAYHAVQVASFAAASADLVTAITMTYAEEAIGIARAAARAGLPVAISFTVETDGRLPDGEPLGEAIATSTRAARPRTT